MPTVLVTRPRAASEKLAAKLKHQGFDSVIEPLLMIEPLQTPMPDIAGIAGVMVTSSNALDALGSGDHDIAGLFGLPCFCVGARTAEKARSLGFRDVSYSDGSGVELAQLIAFALPGGGKTVLHIAAQDIDSRAQDELQRLGLSVVAWPVYAARPAMRLAEQTIRLLEQKKLDAVVVFSVRTAQIFGALLAQERLWACCQSLSAIGLSAAVADALRPLSWAKLAAATDPTEDAMVECLKRLHPVP